MSETAGCSQFVPYSSHITPEIIKLKGGSYLMCFCLKGVNYIGKSQSEIDARVIQINKFIGQMRAPHRYNIYLQSHCIRDFGEASLASSFDNEFADTLNRQYEEKIIHGQSIISNQYYISVIYRPYKRVGSLSAFKTTKKEIASLATQAEETLGKVKDMVYGFFSEYKVEILKSYTNDKGILCSEILEFLSHIINLKSETVPVMRAQISEYLPSSTLSFGSNEYIKIDNEKGSLYASILTLSEYPSATYTGILQAFFELPWRMIITQTFVPIDKSESSGWLEREYKRLENMDSGSVADLEDLIEAREGVLADNFVLGNFYWSVMLFDEDQDKLKRKLSEATAILSNAGFTSSVNKLAKLHSFFAQLPGNIALQPRVAKISSHNSAQMMPYLIQYHGKPEKNPWGGAICMLRTVNDEIFYFNFHDSDIDEDSTGKKLPGNTVISGMTGSGKTVLLSFLLAQAQRYPVKPKTVIFDKDLGSSVFVKALGGKYSQIKLGESTGFNPFHLENTAENRTFLSELILKCLENDGERISASQRNQINAAIAQTMNSPKELASIEAFSNFLPDGDDSIRQRLYPFTHGEYAWVFNNDEDHFSLDGNIIGIDYTQFLDIKAIRTPILMYLFHRIQLMIDGNPMIISLDEAWKPLSDPDFQKFIEDKERTIRKENGILILATQSPADFFRGISDTLMQQMVTQIFLPNPKASRADYIDKLGLEEEEFTRIKDMGIRSREFLIKQQGKTTHCKLSLKNIKAVDVMSGSEDRALIADEMIQLHGNNWINEYYKAI